MTTAVDETRHPGLSEADAVAQRVRHGPNHVTMRRPISIWRRVFDQVRDPMILVLLVAVVQNPFLLWATAAAFGLQVLAVYLPPLQRLLGTEALTLRQLAAVSALAALGYVAARLQGARHQGLRRSRSPDVSLSSAPR